MNKYISPEIRTYQNSCWLEICGPLQTAYADVSIGATAFNTSTSVFASQVAETQYRLVQLSEDQGRIA